jgi:hypothetical protein
MNPIGIDCQGDICEKNQPFVQIRNQRITFLRMLSGQPSHRALAAALAISLRRAEGMDLARAAPPALPPLARLGALLGLSSASPVAMRPTRMAAPITSAGRFSPRGPLGIMTRPHRLCRWAQSFDLSRVHPQQRREPQLRPRPISSLRLSCWPAYMKLSRGAIPALFKLRHHRIYAMNIFWLVVDLAHEQTHTGQS